MITDLRLLTAGRLSNDIIGTLLNRAQKQVLESYPWSFLLSNAVINGATPKTAGTITVGQGTTVVQGVGTHFGLEDIGAFIWIGGLGLTPLPVQSVQGTAVLTLAYPWCGPTLIGSSYVLEPLYYLVEGALEVLSIRANGIELQKRTREYINQIDPTRASVGAVPCLQWCPAPPSPDGSVMVEMWPPSGGPMAYVVDFKRQAPTMVNPNDTTICPYEIVEEKAAEAACLQLYANTNQQSWLGLADRHRTLFLEAYESGKAEDGRRQMDRNGVCAPNSYVGTDANYVPTHDLIGA